jgi:CRISPR/Cas system CSM-associated protein Csm4 (group 5 of RAMP superfamily)
MRNYTDFRAIIVNYAQLYAQAWVDVQTDPTMTWAEREL